MTAARPRRLTSGLLAAIAVAIVLPSAAGAGRPRCLVPPVDAPIVARFVQPDCPYCAGQRGLEYGSTSGAAVRAVAAGEVTFSGVVVGVRYVVVRHADGLLATYGGLRASRLVAGDRVAAGDTVGRAGAGLYFGLRRAAGAPGPDEYLDPEPLLGELVVPPYLVPIDGTPARPAPPAQLRC